MSPQSTVLYCIIMYGDKCKNVFSTRINHYYYYYYRCTICDKRFAKWGTLQLHRRTHTGERPYQCLHCNKLFAQPGNLKRHLQTHTTAKACTCPQCGKTFSHSSQLDIHSRIHTGKRLHTCENCGDEFTHPDSLEFHMKLHSEQETFKCEKCDKNFSSASEFQQHATIHTKDGTYECDICQESFSCSSNLIAHSRQHTATEVHGGNVEKETSHTKENSYEPVEHHTNSLNMLYVGEMCQKVDNNSEDPLNNYKKCTDGGNGEDMLSHTKDQSCECAEHNENSSESCVNMPFVSEICQKAIDNNYKKYTQVCNIEDDMLSHTKMESYDCLICNKSFSDTNSYEDHVKMHSGTPYVREIDEKMLNNLECTVCKKISAGGLQLDAAKESFKCASCEKLSTCETEQTTEKVYTCTKCDEKFVEEGLFEEHRCSHIKKTAYECLKCNKSFADSNSFENHVKLHSSNTSEEFQQPVNEDMGPKNHQCTVCKEIFSTFGDLRQHMTEKTHACDESEKGM